MESVISLTPQDLRTALLRQVKLQDIEDAVLRRMRFPLPGRTASSPLFPLRQVSPELAEMLDQWMKGGYPEDVSPGKLRKVLQIPFCPRGLNVPAYIGPFVKKLKPSVIAVDASPAATGGALHYACSLYNGLALPAKVSLVKETHIREEVYFQPDGFLPELAVFCFQNKIPLVPLGTPARLVASEHQLAYNQLLQEACSRFISEKNLAGLGMDNLEKLAAGFMQEVFNTGIHLNMEREDVINGSCYLASRVFDLVRYLSAVKYKKGPVLILYQIKHALDFPQLVKTFWADPSAVEELYSPLEPQPDGSCEMQALESSGDTEPGPASGRLSGRIGKAVEKFLASRVNEELELNEVDRICSAVAEALRKHPQVERPPGVRGTLAAREIAQGYGLIRGQITRHTLARAAFIAFHHRTGLKPGEETTIEEVFKGIFSRLIYGIPLWPESKEISKERRRALTPEELSQALMGLTDAAFRNLAPDEGLPLDDPAFAEEAMNHPLVQQALKDALEKGLLNDMLKDYQDLVNEMEDRGLLDQLDSSHMTLSPDGQQRLKENLEEQLARGSITPEELAEALKNSKALPAPPGIDGEKIRLTPQAESEMMAELMDFQHQAKSESTTLEDLYVHYTLDEKKGIKVSDKKLDYEKLKIILHQMEKKGLLSTTGEKKRFTLSHLCLDRLLEGLIRRQESQVLERRAFRREHETDKTEVRRYKRGDVFRDISLRHTLRRVIRKGKTLEEINQVDLRSFEKKPSNQLDIAVCVDISASMKESAKLRYAKMAVAELAKAAVDKHDRMGIVAFSNLGEVVVPLTDKITPLLEATMVLRADQFTNIGNGLLCARRMLLNNKKGNPKYIILITDGQPNAALSDDYNNPAYHSQVAAFSRQTTMETKKAMGTHHAIIEAGKTSRNHIKISVIYICPEGEQDDASEKTAREIARIGSGRFHKVKAVERLPLEALATVG